MMPPQTPAPEDHPRSEDAQPVDFWASWYANECRENAVEPTVQAAPSFNPLLVPDINSASASEPSPDSPAPGVSPPPITPRGRED